MICRLFIANKSCSQDNKRTVKDIVSLLDCYIFPIGQTVTICPEITVESPNFVHRLSISHLTSY
jgi:hypothetical protein